MFELASVFVILYLVLSGCNDPCPKTSMSGKVTIKTIEKFERNADNTNVNNNSSLQNENNSSVRNANDSSVQNKNSSSGKNSNTNSTNSENSTVVKYDEFIITLDFEYSYIDSSNKNAAYETRHRTIKTKPIPEWSIKAMNLEPGKTFDGEFFENYGGPNRTIKLTTDAESLVSQTLRLEITNYRDENVER